MELDLLLRYRGGDASRGGPHGYNGAILFALRDGGTLEELRNARLAVTQSQLSLLEIWDLLSRREAVYTTTMPLIDDSTLHAIQEFIDPLDVDFTRSHTAAIRNLTASIAAAGLRDQQYAVLFSYVLDGLTWRELDADGAMPPTKPDLHHPFWNGAFWAVQTKRQVPGTDTSTAGGETTYRTWNDITEKAVSAYPTHRLPPPAFPDKPGTPVHDEGKPLAVALAALIEKVAAAREFHALRVTRRPVVTLILGHEIIWAVMDQIVHDRLVAKPRALTHPNPSLDEVTALIFKTVP